MSFRGDAEASNYEVLSLIIESPDSGSTRRRVSRNDENLNDHGFMAPCALV
jgi:hypothetical protein